MPLPFVGLAAELIEALTGGASRALPYIVHGVDAGLSANSIGDALSEAGLGIRRTNLLTLVRNIRGGIAAAAYQRGLKPDEYPNPAFFESGEGFLTKKYAYVVTVTGENVLTGAEQTQGITISTDFVLTNQELDRQVADAMEAGIQTYQMSLDTYDLERVLVDPRFIP